MDDDKFASNVLITAYQNYSNPNSNKSSVQILLLFLLSYTFNILYIWCRPSYLAMLSVVFMTHKELTQQVFSNSIKPGFNCDLIYMTSTGSYSYIKEIKRTALPYGALINIAVIRFCTLQKPPCLNIHERRGLILFSV